MAPYLTAAQIEARLSTRFGVAATIVLADADIASDDLDGSGPFIGEKQVDGQARQFPRSVNPDGTTNADPAVPDSVLDWVALRAYQLSTDEGPPVKSEGAGGVSVTYAEAKMSQSNKRMRHLLRPYLENKPGYADLQIASSFAREQ